MGVAIAVYLALAVSGGSLLVLRRGRQPRPTWLRPLHYGLGATLVAAIGVLLAIGIVGTLGHFGSLGHSPHLIAGLAVVALTLASAASATQIGARNPWARPVHVGVNIALCAGLVWVGLTGWSVVQKYL